MIKYAALIFVVCLASCQSERESLAEPMASETIDAVGNWKIVSPARKNTTLELDSDGTATLVRNGEPVEGAWETLGDQLWIFWEDGWIDLIEVNGNEYTVSSFGPGTALDATPDRTAKAVRS